MPDNGPSFPQQLGQALADQIRKKMDKYMPTLPDPLAGVDNPRIPQSLPPQDDSGLFVPHLSGKSVVVPFPANKGANFEGYANFNWDMNRPLDLKMNNIGIRYRYPF